MTASTSTQSTNKKILKKTWLARQLSGTSFLTLEHIGYFGLVILAPAILFSGVMAAVTMWSSGSSPMPFIYSPWAMGIPLPYVDTSLAICITASLLVLIPLMYVLGQRISAEYIKRVGYTNRIAYKLPIYTALGLLAVLVIGSLINILSVFLLSFIPASYSGAETSRLYNDKFLSSLLALVIFGMAGWYTFWLAKGKDMSRLFIAIIGLLASVTAVTLFVTAFVVAMDDKTVPPVQPQPAPTMPYDLNKSLR